VIGKAAPGAEPRPHWRVPAFNLGGRTGAVTGCRSLADVRASPRKEVIQPQLPLQLPCYDFVPVTGPALDSGLLAVGRLASGVTSSHDVTGGVYKARERIHRTMADARLLATPTSWGRVAAPNPNYDRLCLDWLRLAAWRPIVPAIVACV
jgi:hypothetical protein